MVHFNVYLLLGKATVPGIGSVIGINVGHSGRWWGQGDKDLLCQFFSFRIISILSRAQDTFSSSRAELHPLRTVGLISLFFHPS